MFEKCVPSPDREKPPEYGWGLISGEISPKIDPTDVGA
jgi:hypothetical protein